MLISQGGTAPLIIHHWENVTVSECIVKRRQLQYTKHGQELETARAVNQNTVGVLS